jgi:hypothetical protein
MLTLGAWGTESSETVSYKGSSKEHLYVQLPPIEILIASFILVSFSTETTSFKLALYKE